MPPRVALCLLWLRYFCVCRDGASGRGEGMVPNRFGHFGGDGP